VQAAAYVETLQARLAAPSVKQGLAAIRRLFDWLVVGQVPAVNPASAVRGPKHVVHKGKAPVLTAEDARALLDSIPPTLWHRAIANCAPSAAGSPILIRPPANPSISMRHRAAGAGGASSTNCAGATAATACTRNFSFS
jgi:integrase